MTGPAQVRCMLMRGGTSKGACFLADDIPAEPARSPRSRSPRMPRRVDYLFLQVGVDTAEVSDRQNCGNLLRRTRRVHG